jgi:translation initiation factor IF-2
VGAIPRVAGGKSASRGGGPPWQHSPDKPWGPEAQRCPGARRGWGSGRLAGAAPLAHNPPLPKHARASLARPPAAAPPGRGQYGCVVDVAGGNGSFLAALLEAHPRLRGVVVDQREQARGARARGARARGARGAGPGLGRLGSRRAWAAGEWGCAFVARQPGSHLRKRPACLPAPAALPAAVGCPPPNLPLSNPPPRTPPDRARQGLVGGPRPRPGGARRAAGGRHVRPRGAALAGGGGGGGGRGRRGSGCGWQGRGRPGRGAAAPGGVRSQKYPSQLAGPRRPEDPQARERGGGVEGCVGGLAGSGSGCGSRTQWGVGRPGRGRPRWRPLALLMRGPGA